MKIEVQGVVGASALLSVSALLLDLLLSCSLCDCKIERPCLHPGPSRKEGGNITAHEAYSWHTPIMTTVHNRPFS